MVNVEVERVSNGWLVTITRDGNRITRMFTLESELAKDLAWSALLTLFEA